MSERQRVQEEDVPNTRQVFGMSEKKRIAGQCDGDLT
jgi:hypothetical protein